ncbi:hypothetical protein LUX05_18310 [Streptomyces somaliensis]|nr:hypothetical protein [Streptomyces somaliensis]
MVVLVFDRWDVACLTAESSVVVPVDVLGGGRLDLGRVFQGRCDLIDSVSNKPIVLSIRALSYASPTDPIEAAMPPCPGVRPA